MLIEEVWWESIHIPIRSFEQTPSKLEIYIQCIVVKKIHSD